MAKRIQVGGRIESKEVGGIVTGAAEILDDAKGKKQSVINGETDDELVRLDQSKQDNLTFDNAPTEGSDNPVKSGGVYAADKALSDAIEAILLLIPSAASALNKLVDTAMMNSSISTATATFRGTYNVVTDLSLTVDATHEQIAAKLAQVVSEADNNDYTFVQVPVSAESTDIRRTERYKFNGTVWGYEYDLNTSGFTAAQWAALNSGITLALVGKLIGLPTSSELQALLGQKQDTLTFDNIPTSGSANPVKSGGVYSAINDEKTAREQLEQTVTGINGRLGNVEEVIPTGAAANNKLVANSSMEAYVTSIINAITASFTIATADGHINLTLTQTNGQVASLTLTSSDIASAQALTALTGRVSTAEGNITLLSGRVSTNETDIANLQQLYNDLQQSKPVPVTELPSTGQQQGVIYRLAGTTSYSDYMWNGSTWVLMATYNNAIDPRPKKASQNLVTSGGVFDNIGALDVSELNATENPHTLAQYVDLSSALAAIPTDYQKGGMSIKFVQSSDNKYVQFRFMLSGSFTSAQFTNPANWQGVDDEPTAGSDNLAKSGTIYKLISENILPKCDLYSEEINVPFEILSEKVIYNGNIGQTMTTTANTNTRCYKADISSYTGKILYLIAMNFMMGSSRGICITDSNNVILAKTTEGNPSFYQKGNDGAEGQPYNSPAIYRFAIPSNAKWIYISLYKENKDIHISATQAKADNYPEVDSDNLVKSKGIAKAISDSNTVICTTLYDRNGEKITLPQVSVAGCFQEIDGNTYTNVSTWALSNFVELNGVKRLRYKGHNTSTSLSLAPILFYDINYSLVGGVKVGDLQVSEYDNFEAAVPADAKFARFCSRIDCNEFSISAMEFDNINVPNTVLPNAVDNEIQKYGTIICNTLLNHNWKLADIDEPDTSHDFTDGWFIDGRDGIAYNNNSYIATDYIYCRNLISVNWRGYMTVNTLPVALISFYDENRQFISSVSVGNNPETSTYQEIKTEVLNIEVPANAVYMRGCCHMNASKNIYNHPFGITTSFDGTFRKQDLFPGGITNEQANSIAEDVVNHGKEYFALLFNKILCIGDSVTEGHIYDYPRTPVNGTIYHQYSYPSMLSQILNGKDVTNAGFSGISASGWWNNKRSLYDYTEYELVLIQLGYNGGLSVDDITTQGTNTYDYRQIISYIKQQNPKAYIVLIISSAFNSARAEAVIEIASRANVPYIDLRKTTYDNLNADKYHGFDNTEMISRSYWHFNRIGYFAQARVILKEIQSLAYNKAEEINNYIGLTE